MTRKLFTEINIRFIALAFVLVASISVVWQQLERYFYGKVQARVVDDWVMHPADAPWFSQELWMGNSLWILPGSRASRMQDKRYAKFAKGRARMGQMISSILQTKRHGVIPMALT